MKYSSIIFDMDGVLLDSTPCHESAFKTVLSRYGINNFVYAQIAGMHTKAAFEKIFTENQVTVGKEELLKCIYDKRHFAFQAILQSKPIEAGVETVLVALSKKYKLALASSASRRLVDWFLKNSNCDACFTVSLSGEDVSEGKPSPEIYLAAAKKLSLIPSQCLVIEDAESGIRSAINAGMDVFVKLGTLKEIPQDELQIKKSFDKLEALLTLL